VLAGRRVAYMPPAPCPSPLFGCASLLACCPQTAAWHTLHQGAALWGTGGPGEGGGGIRLLQPGRLGLTHECSQPCCAAPQQKGARGARSAAPTQSVRCHAQRGNAPQRGSLAQGVPSLPRAPLQDPVFPPPRVPEPPSEDEEEEEEEEERPGTSAAALLRSAGPAGTGPRPRRAAAARAALQRQQQQRQQQQQQLQQQEEEDDDEEAAAGHAGVAAAPAAAAGAGAGPSLFRGGRAARTRARGPLRGDRGGGAVGSPGFSQDPPDSGATEGDESDYVPSEEERAA
jgi:hypothetical protein